ncbi:U3 small nucleolar RNA-associated protein 11 [Massarina eburnea CBS 473.64]|uniref:U3 small nucleolar RNA-associated protein 11 n=1 Tax=Massarina eburnea CBS 473.64 TaxID=1395130 RepID=A0A6A6RST5_9PLEO|nr:U3 small nucleolar RNA-associated protein 11 [Massarina eburnea CBS 473.64]
MSSIRNAVQRRNHKERAQPEERAKWGLLEKRKDYKLRAADHREKKKRIKVLKEKAGERNPDEFSFGMMSSKTDRTGRKVAERGAQSLSTDVVKLLKTQDAGYIRTMLQLVRKEREELERKIVLADEDVEALRDGEGRRKKAKHTVFVGDVEEQEEFDEEEWFGAGAECPKWNRRRKGGEGAGEESGDEVPKKKVSKKQQATQEATKKEQRTLMSNRERTQERAAAHLEAIKARERDLMAAEEELGVQRAKMNNTVGGVNKHGVKFKIRERKG